MVSQLILFHLRLEVLFFKILIVFAIAIVLDDVVEVFVTAAAEVYENGACTHFLGAAHCVSDSMRAFECGDDALIAGQLEKGIDGFFIGCCIVFDPAYIV